MRWPVLQQFFSRKFSNSVLVFLLLAATAFTTTVNANTATKSGAVPKKLFDVELGKIYRLPNQNELNHGDLPVARMTGANRFLGMGLHFYFQPRRPYDLFPFVEEREKPGDKYFKTSFRLYLMPVIPASAKTLADLDKSKSTDHEVVVIEWSHLRKDNEKTPKKMHEDYYWTQNLCKTFEADLGIKPKITDVWNPENAQNGADVFYSCTFSEGDREFEVSSLLGRRVSLNFNKEIFKVKDAAVETQLRKLQAPSVRPY